MAATNAHLRAQVAAGEAARTRLAGRGSLASGAGALSMQVIGMEEVQAALRALASLGAAAHTAHVGTDLVDPPYPYFLEYGTSRMPAYPAARPAWDEMSGVAVQATGDYIGQLIAAGRRDGDAIMATALTEGARHIENRWKELARFRTGDYRRSIHTTVERGVE